MPGPIKSMCVLLDASLRAAVTRTIRQAGAKQEVDSIVPTVVERAISALKIAESKGSGQNGPHASDASAYLGATPLKEAGY